MLREDTEFFFSQREASVTQWFKSVYSSRRWTYV